MKTLTPYLGFGSIIALTILSGVVHGRLLNRWGAETEMLVAAGKLQSIPEQFGDWRLESSQTLEDRVAATLECAGSVVRTYVNQKTQDRVNVAVLLGPAGPIAIHNPEICYSSRDYQVVRPREQVSFQTGDGQTHELWAMTFQSTDLDGTSLRVYFGWSGGDAWFAPENLRLHSAGRPYLYKLQLASVLRAVEAPATDDPCRTFLKDFLPALRPCLAAPVSP